MVRTQSETTASSRRFGWRLLALELAAFLVIGVSASHHLATWPVKLLYPGEEDTIEGCRLAEMVRFRAGVPIYAPAPPRSLTLLFMVPCIICLVPDW